MTLLSKEKLKTISIVSILANCLRIFIIISIGIFLVKKDYQDVAYLVIAFILTFYNILVKNLLKINLSNQLKICILFLIFTAQCLGSVYEFYGKFLWWDTVIHGISGLIFFYIGMTLIEQLNNRFSKEKLHPVIKILFSICFSLAIGVVWEFFEFTVDKFSDANMQDTKTLSGQDAIWDTIQDLLAATIGTAIATIVEKIRIKNN